MELDGEALQVRVIHALAAAVVRVPEGLHTGSLQGIRDDRVAVILGLPEILWTVQTGIVIPGSILNLIQDDNAKALLLTDRDNFCLCTGSHPSRAGSTSRVLTDGRK